MAFPVYIKAAGSKKISVAKEIKEVNRLRLRFELNMARKLNTLFAKTGRRAAQAFTEGANPLAAIGDLGDELNAVFSQQYRTVIDTFADRVFRNQPQKQDGIFYGLFDVYMRRHGTRMVTAVEETTRFHIRKAIQTAQEDGLGVNETAKFIRDRTSGAIGRARSATIARTETHAAASYATDGATRSLNLPNQKKRWVSVGDGRTRPSHAAANGQEVLLDEVFIIRDKGVAIAMKYPHDGNGGPSNNINCRCLAVYFTEDDELFDDLDFSDEVSPLGRGRGRVPPAPLVATPDLPVQAPKPRKPKDRIQIADLVNTGKARGQLFEDRLNEWLSPLTASVAAKLPTPRTITDSKRGFMAYDGELSSHLDRSTLCHEYGHHVDMVMGTAIGIQRAWGANHWSHANFTKPFEKDRKALGIFRVSRDKRDKKLKEIYDELFTQEVIDKGSYTITRSKMKFDGADSLSDILDSMVKGVFRSNYYAYGHEKSYWARGQATANVECFANLYAIHDKPKAMSIARKYFPAMVADFERALKEFNETGDIKSD